MVRWFLLLILVLSATTAEAVTADQLRELTDQKSGEDAQRKNRANTGALGDLVPGKPAPRINKYGDPAARTSTRTAKSLAGTAQSKSGTPESAKVDSSGNIYVPPPRGAGGGSGQPTSSDAVKPSQTFGIRLGSWIECTLERNTTSAENSSVEITVTSDYAGDRRTLPAGTIIYMDKSLNSTTKRMEGVATHGITPDGKEFDMRGVVFDMQKTPGLAGIFVLDKKQVAASGATRGAIAAAAAAVGSVTGNPVSTAATNAASQSVLNDTSQAAEFNHSQQAVIYVSPQPLLIRVERQF